MPENHDAHTIQFFVEKHMVGKALQIRATPAAGIEMESLRVLFDPDTGILEFSPEIVTQRITDRIVMPQRLHDIPPDMRVKSQHQRPRSDITPALS